MKQSEMLLILFFYLFLIALGNWGPRLSKSFYAFGNLKDAGITSMAWKISPSVPRVHVAAIRRLSSRENSTPWGVGSALDLEKKQALGKTVLEDEKKPESLKEAPKG